MLIIDEMCFEWTSDASESEMEEFSMENTRIVDYHYNLDTSSAFARDCQLLWRDAVGERLHDGGAIYARS